MTQTTENNPIVTTLLLMVQSLQKSITANKHLLKDKYGFRMDRFIKDYALGTIKLNRRAGHTTSLVLLANRYSKTRNVVIIASSTSTIEVIKAKGLDMNEKLFICNVRKEKSFADIVCPDLVLIDNASYMNDELWCFVEKWYPRPELFNTVFLGVG